MPESSDVLYLTRTDKVAGIETKRQATWIMSSHLHQIIPVDGDDAL